MRISWVSNAPWNSSGYGNQTKVFTPRILALGHQVAITATFGLEGAVLNWAGMPVYPRGMDTYGNDVMGAHAESFKADVIVSLYDAWVFEPRSLLPGTRWAPWFPVDHEPIPPIVRDKVKQSWHPITYSKFGQRAAEDAGIRTSYVPHGVETKIFAPAGKQTAREQLRWDPDVFWVGMVAANKFTPSRKALPQQIEAFARFHKKHPDTKLYLHTTRAEHGEYQGVNLPELVEYLGVTDAVTYADQYTNLIGYPEPLMVDVYNAIDVLLSVSMGEGFGIPILEAQACGTPAIVGDWTSMGELCFGGWKVARSEAEPWWSPQGAYWYLPHIDAIADRLEQAYAANRTTVGEYARAQALEYDADLVTDRYWRPVLGEMETKIRLNQKLLAGATA